MRIGSIEIQSVRDGTGRERATDVLTRRSVSPEQAWSCHTDQLDAEGGLHLPLGGFLVRTGDRIVLVDVGVGAIDNGKYAGGGLPDSLQALGVRPDDVTDVVFTHLHFDHVGWASRRGEVVFRNATYRVHADDWAHFVESPDAEEGALRKLTPLRGRLETFTDDHAVAPGLSTRHTPGHTPGSTVYVVSDQDSDRRALLLGDAVHSVVELAERDWEAVWDVDPESASVLRNVLADEVADTDDVVVGAHFPDLAFGRVVTTSGSRRFVSV